MLLAIAGASLASLGIFIIGSYRLPFNKGYAMAFAPGDVVVLKSGGLPLTVVAVEEDSVECLWLAEDGSLQRETIPAPALQASEESEDEDDDE